MSTQRQEDDISVELSTKWSRAMKKKNERSKVVNAEALSHFMFILDIDDDKLATAAHISRRTVSRAKNRQSISNRNIKAIAAVLQCKAEQLTGEYFVRPQPKHVPNRRHSVIITLNRPLDQMTKDEQLKLQTMLKDCLRSDQEISFTDVKAGSTIIDMLLHDANVLRLLAAALENKLAVYGIVRIQVPDHRHILSVLAVLQATDGTQTFLDPPATSELANANKFDFLKMRTTNCFFCKNYKEM